MLNQVWTLLDAWGFQYKTMAFVWVKVNKKDYSTSFGILISKQISLLFNLPQIEG